MVGHIQTQLVLKVKNPYRIAIICGHFMPEVGYQEVYLARAISSLGHELKVFTSDKISPSSRKVIPNRERYKQGKFRDGNYPYEIVRLKTLISYSANLLPVGLQKNVDAFDPHIIIIVGVGKVFPYPILRKGGNRMRFILTLLGNNIDMAAWRKPRIKGYLKNILLKSCLYNKSVQISNYLVLYTPSTKEILKRIVRKELHDRIDKIGFQSSLGFDENDFYFDRSQRGLIRSQYKIMREDVVCVTSTRLTPNKGIEGILEVIDTIQKRVPHKRIWYFLIGGLNDAYSLMLKRYIEKFSISDRVIILPFMEHAALRAYYSASDIGIWKNAAISIQESMGTGLYVLLENKSSVNHLVIEDNNGCLYEKGGILNALGELIEQKAPILHDLNERETRRINNFNRFAYSNIAKSLIELFDLSLNSNSVNA